MSFYAISPGHFRNKQERDKKMQEAQCYRDIRTELLRTQEEAVKDRLTRERFNVPLVSTDVVVPTTDFDYSSKVEILRNILPDVLLTQDDVSKVLSGYDKGYIDYLSKNYNDIKTLFPQRVNATMFNLTVRDFQKQQERSRLGLPNDSSNSLIKNFPFKLGGNIYYTRKKIKYGRGVAPEDKPRLREFGRYLISMPYLDDNVVSLRYKSGANLPYAKISISNECKSFLLEFLNTNKFNQRKYNGLSDNERSILNELLKKCKVNMNMILDEPEDSDYNRFILLKGEIEAGQNSTEVLKEFRSLISRFMREGRITRFQGMELLSDLAMLI